MTTAVLPQRGVLADLVPGALVRDAALVIGGAGLTGLAAQASITISSITPVPFTLQTMAVLVVGAALGPLRGALSMLVYLAVGAAGVPWYAGHTHGWAGNGSFGYVIGFVAGAGLVGFLTRRRADRNVVTTVLALVAGALVIYAIGTWWLAVDLHLSFGTAFKLGVRPFLATDAIKIGIAALAFPAAWKIANRKV